MASGNCHDFLGAVVGTAATIWMRHNIHPIYAIPIVAGGVAGVIWLSPDIDSPNSNPTQRWMFLSWIWAPYRNTHGHRPHDWRRLFSRWACCGHWPILGSLERLVYLSFWVAVFGVLAWVVLRLWDPVKATDWVDFFRFMDPNFIWGYWVMFWIGLEAASLFHILCDYLPLVRHDFTRF